MHFCAFQQTLFSCFNTKRLMCVISVALLHNTAHLRDGRFLTSLQFAWRLCTFLLCAVHAEYIPNFLKAR